MLITWHSCPACVVWIRNSNFNSTFLKFVLLHSLNSSLNGLVCRLHIQYKESVLYPLLARTWPLDYELTMFVKLVLDHIQTKYLMQSPQQTISFEIAVTSVGDQAMVLCNLTLGSLMMSSAAGCTLWHSILILWSSTGNIFVYTLNSPHCFGLNIVPSSNRLCVIYIFNVDNPWKGPTQ